APFGAGFAESELGIAPASSPIPNPSCPRRTCFRLPGFHERALSDQDAVPDACNERAGLAKEERECSRYERDKHSETAPTPREPSPSAPKRAPEFVPNPTGPGFYK